MRRRGGIDPTVNEIVREAALSNQAFYRHFRSKDELLVAILDDGLRQLVEYLDHQMAKERAPAGKVRRWVEGVLAQAADEDAAERTRPFVVNSARLADRFPDQVAESEARLIAPLRDVLAELASPDPDRDAEAVYRLVMGRMHDHLIRRQRPARADVEHLTRFALAAVA